MIQTGIEAAKQIAPNTYLIVLLALFVAEKVISMTFRGITLLRGHVNGKKDETRSLSFFQDPTFSHKWDVHTQETHDGVVIGKRLDTNMEKILLESTKQTIESKNQTVEIKKQTRILEKIQAWDPP